MFGFGKRTTGLLGERTRQELNEGERLLADARKRAAGTELADAQAALPLRGPGCRDEYACRVVGREGRDDRRRVAECSTCGASCLLGNFYRARLAAREATGAFAAARQGAGCPQADTPEMARLRLARNQAGHGFKAAQFRLQRAEQRLRDAQLWVKRAGAGMPDPEVGKIIGYLTLDECGSPVGGHPGELQEIRDKTAIKIAMPAEIEARREALRAREMASRPAMCYVEDTHGNRLKVSAEDAAKLVETGRARIVKER